MIAYLKGKIINKGQGFIILGVNNIGYRVYVNATMYADLDVAREIELYAHQHVREDAQDLYGFKNLEELEMFTLLLSISGIGPKSALGVLSVSSVNGLKESIARGDASLLTKVSGIGKKTAERVVLELREKVGAMGFAPGSSNAKGTGMVASGEEIDALMALGYSMMQARDALNQVDASVEDSGERIRSALKKMGR